MKPILLILLTVTPAAFFAQNPTEKNIREAVSGTWELVTVKSLNADTVSYPYGEHPAGSMLLGANGYYSIQIYGEGRSKIASGNKNKATPQENIMLVTQSNAHYGLFQIDVKRGLIIFKPDHAFYPNWEGQELKQNYVLEMDLLTYSSGVSTFGANKSVVVWRKNRKTH